MVDKIFTLFALFWIHWLAASADRIITFKLDHYCLLLVCQCLTMSTHTRFQTFLPIFMLGLILRQPNRPNVVRTMFQFSSKVKIYQASCQVLCRSRQLMQCHSGIWWWCYQAMWSILNCTKHGWGLGNSPEIWRLKNAHVCTRFKTSRSWKCSFPRSGRFLWAEAWMYHHLEF